MFLKKTYEKFRNIFSKRRGFNILHNSLILYFILFLSVGNLVGCGLVNDFLFPTFFILIGIITSFFSKNMTVILTISLVLSNIVKYATKGYINEGFQEEDNKTDDNKKKKINNKNDNDTPVDDLDDYASTKTQTDVKKTKINKDNIEGMQEKYKELMTLQDTILGQIQTLEESLTNAENVVNNIVNSVESK